MSAPRVIVDGYNLLHAHPVYAAQAREDLDSARGRLVSDLAGYAEGGPRTIVVFDGAGNPSSDGAPHHIGSLTVIFSPTGVTADSSIEALAARFRERGDEVLVVTSDVATRETVRSGNVSVRSSSAFARELAAEVMQRNESARAGRKVPVASRIDPDVSTTLARWARGEGDAPHATVKENES